MSSKTHPAPSAKDLGIEGPFEKSLKTEGPEFAPEDKENTLAQARNGTANATNATNQTK